MMVTFVSQCEKKALNRTRRVLDAFANNKALEFMFEQVKKACARTGGFGTGGFETRPYEHMQEMDNR